MRKLTLAMLVALAGMLPGTTAGASPYEVHESNPLGTMQWLPDNALEASSVPQGLHRLVFIYDHSIAINGDHTALEAKGPFAVKIATGAPDLLMKGHSPFVQSLDERAANDQVDPADERFIGLSGDVRNAACAKVGTADFSAAFTLPERSFFWPGTRPYRAKKSGGSCEIINSSTAVTDAAGKVLGFDTTVASHVPGFWIDVEWTDRDDPAGVGSDDPRSGKALAEVWYSAAFDTAGEDGQWYEKADSVASGNSIGAPDEYDYRFYFTALPGGVGTDCVDNPDVADDPPFSYDDERITVPTTAKSVTFHLWPAGDWDLLVFDPEGTKGVSGLGAGFAEKETVPDSGDMNGPSIAELVPGEFTFRACNYTGEHTVLGAVDIA